MMKGTRNGQEYYRLYIDGKWVDSSSNKLIAVQNPANEEVIGHVTDANAEDVELALKSSERAQLEWQALPAIKRAEYLLKLVDKIKENKEHFAKLLVMEQGKTYGQALGEVDDTVGYIMYAVEAANKIKGDVLPSNKVGEMLMIQKVPYGVTIGLCAWNYPLALIGRKLGPALITGNTMIIKPHELTPIASAEFFKLIDEVGFPPGVANFVTGTGPEVGNLLVSSPITKLVTVTGSVRAGQAIYKAASNNITALSLELGGKAPFIVLDDADVDAAVNAAVTARFANCGQVCVCNELVLVHEKVADEFYEQAAGASEKCEDG